MHPKCNRFVHEDCYTKNFLHKNRLTEHFDPNAAFGFPLLSVACTKSHYTYGKKQFSVDIKSRNVPWDKDGPNGPTDPNNSMKAIIDLCFSPGNYRLWRGDTVTGLTKTVRSKIYSQRIKERGILKEREPDAIRAFISRMEGSWRETNDWANNTGDGVLESQGKVTFDQILVKKCPWYFDIYDVMVDCASSSPIFNSDTAFGSGDEEDNDTSLIDPEDLLDDNDNDDDNDNGSPSSSDDNGSPSSGDSKKRPESSSGSIRAKEKGRSSFLGTDEHNATMKVMADAKMISVNLEKEKWEENKITLLAEREYKQKQQMAAFSVASMKEYNELRKMYDDDTIIQICPHMMPIIEALKSKDGI